jgi:hypothetical protein
VTVRFRKLNPWLLAWYLLPLAFFIGNRVSLMRSLASQQYVPILNGPDLGGGIAATVSAVVFALLAILSATIVTLVLFFKSIAK